MSMFYNLDKLYSRDFLIGFVLGERGCGKTYASKLAMLKHFLKTGEQFIYLRRYKTELDTALATFWSDLQENGDFDDLDLDVRKSKMLNKLTVDGKVCGYAIPLSTANILKSTGFPKVKTIIFDEFLLDSAGGTYKYLKNEATLFLDVYETVFRLREGKAILLGNTIAPHSSPLFAYFNLELPENGQEFRTFKDGAIVVQYVRNLEYREAKKKSRFGQLIQDTEFGRYAIDNVALRENNYFIQQRPSKCSYQTTIIINGTNFGLWNGSDGCLYVSNKYDPNSEKYAFDFNDHTDSTVFDYTRHNLYINLMIKAYKRGWLKFESQKIKANVCSLLNKCIAI